MPVRQHWGRGTRLFFGYRVHLTRQQNPPGPSLSLLSMPFSATIIDDRNSTVTYTGTWVVGGTTNEHDDTVSSSVKVGDKFTVPFTGTAIGVYGTYDSTSGGVKTSYAIDGNSVTTVTANPSANGLDDYQQLFWQSDTLSSGSHSLVVTMVAVNSNAGDGEGTVWFDFFNVTNAASSSSSSSSSSGTSTGKSTSTGSSSPATASSSSTTAVATKKSSHSGIIGGLVVAIIVLILCALFLYRRKRRAYSRTAAQQMHQLPPTIEPYLPAQASSAPMGGFPGSAQPLVSPYAQPGSPAAPGPKPAYDPRGGYAPPAGYPYGRPSQGAPIPPGAFDPYASMASAHPPPPMPQPSSYAPSSASGPSSSTFSTPQRGPLSVVGGSSSGYSDSIADLKRRQQEVVDSYEAGVSGRPLVQHVDSGVRELDSAAQNELPPVYTPH
ncbi:hypothetical protein B0H10DRAFT_2074100 [Mycena sp. CBHHK59/15]|nr:hypothetical protein B0H10DRAFT_2074100 [Mycena sp. CBHHK59/15]